MDKYNEIIEKMTLDELCGQLLCYTAPLGCYKDELDNFEKIVKRTKPGGIFVASGTKAEIDDITAMINQYTKVPVIVAGDTENGPNPVKDCALRLPHPMAWGACDDADAVEKGGMLTARLCRQNGIHWSFAPLVDINYNKDNPVVNTRAVSDSPEQVVKIAGAYLRGIQKEGLMAGGCKHFPGDGVDDRNQHFCTSVNSLSKEEWWKTYGYVYKKILAEKPVSVMVGHISAPALQPTEDFDEVTGYKPATLSRELMTGLLRGELGFDGCIVSDALSMVGVATAVPEERLPVEFINAGGDMALFAEPEYFDYIKNAVTEGIIPMPRLKDAVSRILAMKDAVGLLSKEQPEIGGSTELEQTAMQIAEKSIKIVRDAEKILPLNIKPGENVLICNLMYNDGESDELPSFATVERELNRRGILTTVLQNPKHRDIERVLDEKKPACVLVNSRYSMRDCSGSSLRIGWSSIKTFWRGLVFRHPRVIFTSFADPYKLYELPFLKTYINTFSPTVESQKAFVRVILGEIEAKGKNPVALDGFFDREV